MIVLFDTSTAAARMVVITKDVQREFEWESNRELAKKMLSWIDESLKSIDYDIKDITGLGVYKGPGSFTGLRIGMSVLNTLADSMSIPIVAATGENWQSDCEGRLRNGENDKIALPLYDREANITMPRK